MKSLFVLLVLLCCLCISQVQGQIEYQVRPGLKNTLTQVGLEYLKDVAMNYLQSTYTNLTLSEIKGSDKSPIGKIDYTLSEFMMDDVRIPISNLQLQPGYGLLFNITKATAQVAFHWHYHQSLPPYISGDGNGHINATEVEVYIQVGVNVDQGKPVVYVEALDISVGDMNIYDTGGASWWYNLLIKLFKGTIKGQIIDELKNVVIDDINAMSEKIFENVPTILNLTDSLQLDYGMLWAPEYYGDFVMTSHKGRFFYSGENVIPAYNATEIPNFDPTGVYSEHLQLFIDEYMAQTAFHSFFVGGDLYIQVAPGDEPAWLPISLNTSNDVVRAVIPQLYETCPGCAMSAYLYANHTPVATFHKDGCRIQAGGDLQVNYLEPNTGQWTPAFIVSGEAFVIANATLIGNGDDGVNISLKLEDVVIEGLHITELYMEEFNVTNLQATIDFIGTAMIPVINEKIAYGFPLPLFAGVSMQQPVTQWNDTFLYIGTNITWQIDEPYDHRPYFPDYLS